MAKDNLQDLSSEELQKQLIEVTIGGAKKEVNPKRKAALFKIYIERAFPKVEVLNVEPTNTAAALYSVSGIVQLRWPNGKIQEVFGKIHIEANTGSLNPLGAANEYANAQLLAEANWPILQPLSKSNNPDYPLLLYPVQKEPALFDKLEASHTTGIVNITNAELEDLDQYNLKIGQREVESIKAGTIDEAINAPVQNLFLSRIKEGGRIDQWYKDDTSFDLPGLEKALSWKELLNMNWQINNHTFDITLQNIIDQARKNLSFEKEQKVFLTISHGDDHSGNVRLTKPPQVFDPAFAGWNPASMDLKALGHTGFLPMAAMYYYPKGLEWTYKQDDQILIVTNNMTYLPGYPVQEQLAKQIIDYRTIPLLSAIKSKKKDISADILRIKSGLAVCALLTVNIAKLLTEPDGRAIGLLPIALMFAQLKGLPMLTYLDKEIDQLMKGQDE